MSKFLMVAPHTRTITGDDKIFGINNAAQLKVAEIGSENVVNATIGALLDDAGKLMIMPSIIDTLKNLSPADIAAYAPIAGVPSYLEHVKTATFRNYFPEGYMESIATPGGTGAIRNTIKNYSSPGDYVLTSDWFWSPYKTIADENDRKIATYKLFDENKQFNVASFEEKVAELLKKQTHLVILLNAPAHNPTGYSPSLSDWDAILDVIKTASKDASKKITLFVDVAYIDFAGDPDDCRKFFPKLSNLPENILTVVAFSMSKGYTLYGMRSGAMIAISSSKAITDEFKMVNMYSNRGTWSNGTRPAMMILSKIFEDEKLLKKVDAERQALQTILTTRANTFLAASKEVGLDMCPYQAGFFMTMPCANADQVGLELQKDSIFMVPIGEGLRFAVSAVADSKCSMVPEKMVAAISKFK